MKCVELEHAATSVILHEGKTDENWQMITMFLY